MQIPTFIRTIKQWVLKLISSSMYFQWKYIIFQSYVYKRKYFKSVKDVRNNNQKTNNKNKRIVFLCDKKNACGGLIDRLRAIVSIYKTCKELNLEFNILFTDPFDLNSYLQPNLVQWKINPNELNYNTRTTDVCFIGTPTRAKWLAEKQEEWFKKRFKKEYSEFHVISNTSYSYYYDFATLFSELFKPSPHLEKLIENQRKYLSDDYISVSCRFRDLLNDFNETCPLNLNLSVEEQEALINKNIEQLEILHEQYPGKTILVNSDSIRFLNAAKKKEYTYIIPGEIGHIDNKNTVATTLYDKVFADFFMIANAEHIYLFQTGFMFESGFPYAAALIYNRPFTRITF